MIPQLTERIYNTRSIDFATLLRYALPDRHIATVKDDNAAIFYFEDFDECRSLAASYWGQEPLAIGDLRAYVDAGHALRKTMKLAHRFGRWDRDHRDRDREESTGE